MWYLNKLYVKTGAKIFIDLLRVKSYILQIDKLYADVQEHGCYCDYLKENIQQPIVLISLTINDIFVLHFRPNLE